MSDFDGPLERLLLDPEFKAALAANPDRILAGVPPRSRTARSRRGRRPRWGVQQAVPAPGPLQVRLRAGHSLLRRPGHPRSTRNRPRSTRRSTTTPRPSTSTPPGSSTSRLT